MDSDELDTLYALLIKFKYSAVFSVNPTVDDVIALLAARQDVEQGRASY